jgi:cellulose synthase/poly-beta-1,6-N-acetylglucosamine synthase-like glycosyltransferase
MPEPAPISRSSRPASELTIIVPAYNEVGTIADTVRSLQNQTVSPEEIIVVDDCSSDGTGEVARRLGATVIRPPTNTGSKAGAQTFALAWVNTELTVAIDADTTLAPNALERLLAAMKDREVVAACGYVLPRRVRSLWERGRYIEYLFAFTFAKQVQNYYGHPLICSGCLSAYRTESLRRVGGWSTRTMAEDMDLTWSFYAAGSTVRFVPQAVCYPIEPHNLNLMHRQLRRWSHGFVQNVRLHWREVAHVRFLRSVVAVALWDAALAPLVFFLVVPLLAALLSPFFLTWYALDAPTVLVPVLIGALSRRELGRALLSFPAFFVLRLLNAGEILAALWLELVMRRRLKVYEKGH